MMKRRTLLASPLLARPVVAPASVVGLSVMTGLFASSAHANVATPSPIAAALPGAAWAGSSRLRFLGFDVYDASLFVTPDFRASTFEQHPLALELTYLRSLSGKAIAERSIKEMRRGALLTPEQEQRWLAAMQEAFPDVRTGDRITGLHRPGVGAQFWLNGQLRASIADPEFSRLFFGIWLSSKTSEPAMRTSLLERAAP